MKNRILVLMLFVVSLSPLQANTCNPHERAEIECCECKSSSRTFFSVRPSYQIDAPEYESLFYDRTNACTDGHHGALQFTPFGSVSINEGSLASYFTPFCKSALLVQETPTDSTDFLASEFGIATTNGNFSSIVSFAPKQTTAGFGISYKQAFKQWEDGRELWLSVSMPVAHVRNTLGLYENILNNGDGISQAAVSAATTGGNILPVANMTQALNNPAWNYGKIPTCTQSKTGIADITVQAGYLYLNKPEYQIESYVGLLIPTGNKPKALTLFEPIIGHNQHAGLIMGNNLDVEIWHHECGAQLWMHLHTHGLFLLKKIEKRLMDVKYKPWSRYMQLYANQAQATTAQATDDSTIYTPGVNVFARDVYVSPGFLRSFNTAFLLSKGSFEGEFGYNFFSRPAECVTLATPWTEKPAFKSQVTAGSTNGFLTIDNNPAFNTNPDLAFECTELTATNYAHNIITENDLDILSAEHPSMITHTMYATLGYRFDDYKYPALIGIGASYEFALDNSGLSRVAFWAKGGISF